LQPARFSGKAIMAMAASTRRARLAGCAPLDIHIAVVFILGPILCQTRAQSA
jgi:hypothetical protein